jgi:hypothetical protein
MSGTRAGTFIVCSRPVSASVPRHYKVIPGCSQTPTPVTGPAGGSSTLGTGTERDAQKEALCE